MYKNIFIIILFITTLSGCRANTANLSTETEKCNSRLLTTTTTDKIVLFVGQPEDTLIHMSIPGILEKTNIQIQADRSEKTSLINASFIWFQSFDKPKKPNLHIEADFKSLHKLQSIRIK